jgi:hypothetical protein
VNTFLSARIYIKAVKYNYHFIFTLKQKKRRYIVKFENRIYTQGLMATCPFHSQAIDILNTGLMEKQKTTSS